MCEKENISETPLYHPVEIENPFTKEEISKVVWKLKNNKSPGIDNVDAELIRNGPDELHEMIADIFQLTSSRQNFPAVLSKGILVPPPKPTKKDVNVNVSPIILLSILRKILTLHDRKMLAKIKTSHPN